MFKRPDDPPEYYHLYGIPAAGSLAFYGAGTMSGHVPEIDSAAGTLAGLLCIGGIGGLSSQSTARLGAASGQAGVALGVVSTLYVLLVQHNVPLLSPFSHNYLLRHLQLLQWPSSSRHGHDGEDWRPHGSWRRRRKVYRRPSRADISPSDCRGIPLPCWRCRQCRSYWRLRQRARCNGTGQSPPCIRVPCHRHRQRDLHWFFGGVWQARRAT